jgi:hypothetical protein
MGGEPSSRVGAPVFGQVQFAVDEGMAAGRDVGEKDAHLAVFHAPADAAILRSDPGRVASPFGKATFIEHQDGEGRLVLLPRLRREQGLVDQGA